MSSSSARRHELRLLAAGLAIAGVLSACGSTNHRGASGSSTTSTTGASSPATKVPDVPNQLQTPNPNAATGDPDHQYNPIPFNVGDLIGLPNGWSVKVTKVTRPYDNASLAAPPEGQQYVGVNVKMQNNGTAPVDVKVADIFALVDDQNRQYKVVSVAGQPNGLDGSYPPGTTRTAELVFPAAEGHQLRMLLNGPAIGTQLSQFQIDPPKAPAHD